MDHLEFDFEPDSPEQGEILIALLTEAGFEGFEETTGHLKAFIPENSLDEAQLNALTETLHVKFSRTRIAPRNWNEQWEHSFNPIVVGDFVSVRAPFHTDSSTTRYEIVIMPKMSFGTGHHATTYLMLEQMSRVRFDGKTVLDFGTGTGILAILAEKMGASRVLAIDHDDWSIDNAKENIGSNGCTRIEICKADTLPENESFDVILANINLNVILANLPAIVRASSVTTEVYLSGFLKSDELVLFSALAKAGFLCVSITQKGDWICLHVRKMS